MGSEADITAALQAVHLPSTKPKANFPLPRELRDQIYSYLLSSGFVKHTPTRSDATQSHEFDICESTAHAYSFGTGILAVSRDIAREAKEYLYKNNTFVLVEYECSGFSVALHNGDVPIVADRKIESFGHACVQIKVVLKNPPWISISQRHDWPTPRTERGTVLMLLDDFAVLARMLRLHLQYSLGRCLYVVSSRNEQLDITVTEATTFADVKIELMSTTFQHQSTLLQDCLLASISHVIGGGMKVQIVGAMDSAKAALVETKMAPHVVWAAALHWSRLRTALELKRCADDLATAGNTRQAYARYSYLVDFFCISKIELFPVVASSRNEDLNAAMARVAVLLCDLMLSRMYLHVRTGNVEGPQLQSELHGVFAIVRSGVVPREYIFKVLHFAMALQIFKRSEDNVTTRVNMFLAEAPRHPNDLYALHDSALMRNDLSGRKVSSPRRIPTHGPADQRNRIPHFRVSTSRRRACVRFRSGSLTPNRR